MASASSPASSVASAATTLPSSLSSVSQSVTHPEVKETKTLGTTEATNKAQPSNWSLLAITLLVIGILALVGSVVCYVAGVDLLWALSGGAVALLCLGIALVERCTFPADDDNPDINNKKPGATNSNPSASSVQQSSSEATGGEKKTDSNPSASSVVPTGEGKSATSSAQQEQKNPA